MMIMSSSYRVWGRNDIQRCECLHVVQLVVELIYNDLIRRVLLIWWSLLQGWHCSLVMLLAIILVKYLRLTVFKTYSAWWISQLWGGLLLRWLLVEQIPITCKVCAIVFDYIVMLEISLILLQFFDPWGQFRQRSTYFWCRKRSETCHLVLLLLLLLIHNLSWLVFFKYDTRPILIRQGRVQENTITLSFSLLLELFVEISGWGFMSRAICTAPHIETLMMSL